MMDRDDVIDLLTIISVLDNRGIGETDVTVWHQMIGHLAKDDAVKAIEDHHRDCPGVWIEPGHVVARVRAARRDAYERADVDYRQQELVSAGPEVRRDQFGYVDKGEPDDDEDEYPADWTPEQRVQAYWAKIQAHRDRAEYDQAIAHPGSLLLAPPASVAARAKAITEYANSRQLSFDDDAAADDAVPHVNALLVGCPFCRASVGDPCTKAGMPGKPREKLVSIAGHPARIELAARQAGHPEAVVEAIVALAAKRQARAQRSQWTDRDEPIVPIAAPAPEPAQTSVEPPDDEQDPE